ncbi:putative aldo/keto reductase, partial [Thozetella sp. PMI_491]
MTSQNIPLRRLGQNGPLVPALGLGLMGMSIMYGSAPSDEERFAVLDSAIALGATFWDTSDYYGDCEQLLGNWFQKTGKRHQVFLATKFGVVKGTVSEIDSSKEHCKKACYESLQTLGVDYIDLYYMHRANPNTPIEDTMRGLAELKAEGKIKYIGLSEVSASTLRRACKIAHVDALQVEYSAFEREVEDPATNILATCRELGVALVAYSPLGRGMLSGTLTSKESISGEGDWRAQFPRFSGTNFEANNELVSRFQLLAEKKGCTSAQLALAWLLKQGDDIIPIPGTKRVKYLQENWAALNVQLDDTDVAEIRALLEATRVAGARVVEWASAQCLVDTKEE